VFLHQWKDFWGKIVDLGPKLPYKRGYLIPQIKWQSHACAKQIFSPNFPPIHNEWWKINSPVEWNLMASGKYMLTRNHDPNMFLLDWSQLDEYRYLPLEDSR